MVQLPGWREGIQRELGTLERRGNANLMKSNKVKCKVLLCSNSRHTSRMGGEVVESSPVEKDWGVMADEKAQYELAVCTSSTES